MRPAILQTDTLNQAVWGTSGRQPHLETFHLYLAHPSEPLSVALIFRLFAHAEQRYGEVEAIFMQRGKPLQRAVQRWPQGRVQSDPERAGVGIAESNLQHNASQGLVRGGNFSVSWDLTLADRALGYAGLPAGWSKCSVNPRLYTPHPSSRVLRGKLEIWQGHSRHVPVQRLELRGWHGMQGHWIARRPAQPYVWVHASQFANTPADSVTFEAFAGALRLGRLIEPTAQLARLTVGETTYRFDGWRNLFDKPPETDAAGWNFTLRSGGSKLRGSVKRVEASAQVEVPGAPPDKPLVQQIGMLANLELILEPQKGLPQTFISQRAVYLTQSAAPAAAAAAAAS